MPALLLTILCLGGAVLHARQAGAEDSVVNALANGGFEEGQGDSLADGWRLEPGARRVQESVTGGKWALSLSGTEEHPDLEAAQRISLPEPRPFAATVACMLKVEEVQGSKGSGGKAVLRVSFFDQKKTLLREEALGEWDKPVRWRPCAGTVEIPPEAVWMDLRLQWSGGTGRAVFDDVRLLWNLPEDYDRKNWVVDGGFEYLDPKSAWEVQPGQKILYPGREGYAALKVTQEKSEPLAAATQLLSLEGAREAQRAMLQLWIRMENVKEAYPGGGAKAKVLFRDDGGKPVGQPFTLGPWKG